MALEQVPTMKLTVCQIIPTLVQGGAEKQMSLLAMHLDRQLFDCHVIALTETGPWEAKLRSAGVQVHFVGKNWRADPRTWLRLNHTLREINPQIVQTWLFAANSYGRLAAARSRVPVIIANERCVNPWKHTWQVWIDRWMIRYTRRITTNSSGVADFYARQGIPRDLFEVIPNAVYPACKSLPRAELFKRLNLPERKYIVAAVGRLWPQKGYPNLLWAAELLRVALRDVWVIVLGDGPQLDYLQRLRDDYGCQDAVRFVGHRSDAIDLLSAVDLFWNGSLYEGQSNAILEAMAAEVPVLATDIPGNRDLVVHRQTGYLYPVGDVNQLIRWSAELLQDPSRRASMGLKARQRIEQYFSIEQMVSAYSHLYQRLISNGQFDSSR